MDGKLDFYFGVTGCQCKYDMAPCVTFPFIPILHQRPAGLAIQPNLLLRRIICVDSCMPIYLSDKEAPQINYCHPFLTLPDLNKV